MEDLTPIQRIIVIIIGLVLTLAVALLVLPWISKQIEGRLMPSEDTASDALAPSQRWTDLPITGSTLTQTAVQRAECSQNTA